MAIPNPVKYLRFISRIVRYAHKIGDRTNLGLWQQGVEVYRLLRLNRLEPKEYYETYGLYLPDISWDEKRRFLSRNQFAILDRELNPKSSTGVLNKLVFKIYAERFGLAVPKMYGLFNAGFGFRPDGRPLRTVEQLRELCLDPELPEFLLKPTSAGMGAGIMLIERREGDKLYSLGEGEITIEELHQRLSTSNFSGNPHVPDSWLIEERVRQHPWLDHYSSTCTQNIRVVTFTNASGRVEKVAAGLNIALQGDHISTVSKLKMAAGLDDNGVLGRAVVETPEGLRFFDHHPESDCPITGETLPGYHEAVDLALRAQATIPQLRLLGWDIAITADGPTILEGNPYWNWETIQRANRRGVIHGSLARELPDILYGS